MKKLFMLSLLTLLFALPARAVSNFDITFNLGPSIFQSGGIEDLGEPDLNTGLEFNYFFRPQHGMGFGFGNEWDFDGSRDLPVLNEASISTFDIHYSYRHIMDKLHIVFEPGFGWQTLYDQARDYYWGYWYYDDLSTSFVLNYKLFARYMVKEWDSPDMSSSGSFFIGAGIQQNFSLDDSFAGKDISGSRFSALFQVGLGF